MSQDETETQLERRDFFISYTGTDRQWAEWIALQLEQAGYTLFIQAWDFRPGANFVAEMDHAAKYAERTLLVLSPTYLKSDYAFAEWAAAFRHDPKGTHGRLLPVRIEPCEVEGLLGPVIYIDLVSLEEDQARERLLAGVQPGRVRPATVAFPRQDGSPIHVAFPGSLPAIWTLSFPRNPFFTGREDMLEQLHMQLQTTQTAALSQPQAISGLGGIGKTQLALEYAYRYRQEYQAVLWARADTIEALNASYTEIARLLQLPQKDAQEQEVIVQAVKNWFRSRGGWLLILDNADDLDIVQAFLPTECPGHLLLTTRSQIMGKLAQRLEVETLDREVGALLLLRRARLIAPDAPLDAASPSNRSIANALTEELGGLPLALDQAGAYIEETQCSLADYRRQYQTRRAELLAFRGKLMDEHPEPVTTTWSLSFAKVEQANPMAAELLRACAFLAPDAIPEELLVEVLKKSQPASKGKEKARGRGGWFSRLISGQRKKQESTSLAAREGGIDEAVVMLRAYSLVQRNATEKTLSVHRLVQAVLRDSLAVETQRHWMQRTIEAVAAAYPDPDFATSTWFALERFLPHALICATWIEQAPLLATFTAARLLNGTGLYLKQRARFREAEPLYQQALAIWKQQLGIMHPDTAISLNNLARLYTDQGKYAEAEPLFQRALRINEQMLGTEHPSTQGVRNNYDALSHKMKREKEGR